MRSFSISKVITLGAGADSGNVLQGTRLAPSIGNGFLSIWVTATVADQDMKLLVQSDEVASDFEVSNANAYPKKNEDWAIRNIPINRGDVVSLSFLDRGGAGSGVTYIVEFTPAGGRRTR